MSDPEYTRCPGCRTIFRVTAQQLALRSGQVRCGHCKNVFDGAAERVTLAPKGRDEAFHDERRDGPETVTLRSEHALAPVGTGSSGAGSAPSGVDAPGTPDAPREGRAADPATADDGAAAGVAPASEVDLDANPDANPDAGLEAEPESEAESEPEAESRAESESDVEPEAEAPAVPYEERFSQLQQRRYPSALERAYPIALPLLLLLLLGQAAFHFRDALAAHLPAAKPVLTRVCEALGCGINPLRDSAGLAIDASDLQADPAHKGLLLLTATLRNRAGWSVAYPHLELTLTDAQDQVVVRRALAPADYARGTADIAGGIPANGEVPVRLFIDASATTQAGYRLYAFYP